MMIVCVIIEIALIIFTVATKFYADVVPLFGELYMPCILVSVAFGIITLAFIGARIYVDVNGKRKDKNKKDE